MNSLTALSAPRRIGVRSYLTFASLVGFALVTFLSPMPASSARADDKPPASYTIPLPPAPDFSALDWLVGDWAGPMVGKHNQGEVHLSVSYTLSKRFMIFHGQLAQPATKTAPATEETWMGVLGPAHSNSDLMLRVYSSTGFSTNYRVTAVPNEVEFNPAGGDLPAGWLFRRRLERVGESSLSETLEVAPPGKAFFKYYTAQLMRMPPKETPQPKVAPPIPEP
jgi:hypothetical protein